MEFSLCKAEQPLKEMELQEKEEETDERHIGKHTINGGFIFELP